MSKVEEKQPSTSSSGSSEEDCISVKQCDMSDELREECVAIVREAFAQTKLEKDAATAIKKALDEKYPKTSWHCIVGQHFAVSITHATKNLVFLSLGRQNVLLFKSED